jgi:hypothetical protein
LIIVTSSTLPYSQIDIIVGISLGAKIVEFFTIQEADVPEHPPPSSAIT